MVSRKSFLVFLTCACFSCFCNVYAEDTGCDNGYYDNGVCIQCGENEYPKENHDACSGCTAPNEYIEGGVCKICASGSYVNEQHTSCSGCDAINEYIEGGVCKICASGSYVNEQHTSCSGCDDDAEYHDNNLCKVCENNLYANLEHTACTGGCAPGSYCADSSCNTCNACEEGFKCPGRTIEDGVITSFGAKQLCPKGTFSTDSQSECQLCPIGFTTKITGATSIADCIMLQKVTLNLGGSTLDLPNCLTIGKINKDVVERN